tara:strand:+ start:4439 stop:6004 length:1566 start_codon:yes stop_codon:yes gene_type:complete
VGKTHVFFIEKFFINIFLINAKNDRNANMSENFVTAIKQLSKEKNLDPDTVFDAVETAMASAFRKDDLQYANLQVSINKDTGEISIKRIYSVIDDDEIEDDEIEVSPERALEMGHKTAKIGELIHENIKESKNLGRIAAQTTKQVVLQRIREAERDTVHHEYSEQIGELVSGTIIRIDQNRNVIVDIGKAEGIIPQTEQIKYENYRQGQRIKLYIKDVNKVAKGPQIIFSRKSPQLVAKLLELEVPEISKGIIKIIHVSRIAGRRTKIAIIANQLGIDPIGSVVGIRGSRIQNVINDLNGERIDLIRWDPNISGFIASALSPAEVVSIDIDARTKTALIAVPDRQLSLAIGKNGENATLAAQLTGHTIDIRGESAVINAKEDLIPPPEPNLTAILDDNTEIFEKGKTVAQITKDGETITEDVVQESNQRLTPEQEIIQKYTDSEINESGSEKNNDASVPIDVQGNESRTAGIRFAEEFREINREESTKKTKNKKRKSPKSPISQDDDTEEYSEYRDLFKED